MRLEDYYIDGDPDDIDFDRLGADIDKITDANEARDIEKQLSEVMADSERSLEKVQNRIKFVRGEISEADWLESIGETDKAKAR